MSNEKVRCNLHGLKLALTRLSPTYPQVHNVNCSGLSGRPSNFNLGYLPEIAMCASAPLVTKRRRLAPVASSLPVPSASPRTHEEKPNTGPLDSQGIKLARLYAFFALQHLPTDRARIPFDEVP